MLAPRVKQQGTRDVAEKQSYFDKSARTLSGITLLMEAPPQKIAELEKSCEWFEYAPDEVVVDLKDETTNVFFIVEGKLKAMDFISQEDEQVALAELGPGDSIGELSAIDLKVRSARVSATEHCLLASLSSKEFRTLLLDCPGISLALLKRFSGYIRTLNTRITALSTMSPHQRIYHELLRISEPNADGDGSWIIVNAPHHSEIAEWVGAEKQTVAEAIGNLAREGVIARKHKNLVIKDRARLQRLASQ